MAAGKVGGMVITVCVCTRDRPGYLRNCLEGLRNQTAPADAFEIVVVDSASTGDVPAQLAHIVAGHGNARLLREERPGLSRARNAGAQAAYGGYIAYIDDDAIPAPDWIECILAALAE